MLSLTVREITSVSATFVLSSRWDDAQDPSLVSLGLDLGFSSSSSSDVETERDRSEAEERKDDSEQEEDGSHAPTLADTLDQGLSVTVNGTSWSCAFVRVDERLDEAVVIIYALMPGRVYEVGVEVGGTNSGLENRIERTKTKKKKERMGVKGKFVTLDTPEDIIENLAGVGVDIPVPTDPVSEIVMVGALPPSEPYSTSSNFSIQSSGASITANPSISTEEGANGIASSSSPVMNSVNIPQVTLNDRLSQLQHTLSLINAERDTLLTQIKSLRRTSQKADASLRAEIETLKRTSEKHSAFEARGKQKVLALQEAVKRAQIAARECEDLRVEVEGETLVISEKKEEKENELDKVMNEAESIKREKESLVEKEKKRMEGMRNELSGLSGKLDRLAGKREKMEGSVLPELEKKVSDVERELEEVEQEVANFEMQERTRIQLEETYMPFQQQQRRRQNSVGPIGRPVTIQRPSFHEFTSTTAWTPANSTLNANRQIQARTHQTHTPRSQSLHTHLPPPGLPHRRSSLKSTSVSATGSPSSTTSSPSTSVTTLNTSAEQPLSGASTTTNLTSSPQSMSSRSSPGVSPAVPPYTHSVLSTRAPAFEPSSTRGGTKPSGLAYAFPRVHGSTPAPSQVPAPVGAGRPWRRSIGTSPGVDLNSNSKSAGTAGWGNSGMQLR